MKRIKTYEGSGKHGLTRYGRCRVRAEKRRDRSRAKRNLAQYARG